MKKTIRFAAAGLAAIGLFAATTSCDVDAALLRGAAEPYVFPPGDANDPYRVDADKILQMDLVSLADPANKVTEATLKGLYLGDPAEIATDTVILYLHGNANSMNAFWNALRHMANIGGHHRYGVLCYDYRGFGNSQGPSTGTASMRQDLHAALRWLKDRGLTADRLVVFGNSLGTLPGAQEAGEQVGPLKIDKLVLECPQSNADAFFQDAVGLSVPASLATDYQFDVDGNMARYPGALLWMHGLDDDVAPIDNAKYLYDAHQGRSKKAHLLAGVGHNVRGGWGAENWGAAILDFVTKE
jgi:pimeloyl-ACP methyl ester carboxylesterase